MSTESQQTIDEKNDIYNNMKKSLLSRYLHPDRSVVSRVKQGVDLPMLITVILLVCFGSVMIFSSGYVYALQHFEDSFFFVKRQFFFCVLGIAVMTVISHIDYKIFRRFALPVFVASLLFLMLVLVPGIGVTAKGATRWLGIGPLQFQPSEIAKFSLVLILSDYVARNSDRIKKFKYGIMIPAVITITVCALTILERHMSGTIILFMIGACMIFISGASMKWLLGIGGTFSAAILSVILFTDYAKKRIDVWLNPESDLLGGGWQPYQSLLAIGSGGFFGVGLGNSYQKHLWLPEPHNDFIFSVVCEELGFIGASTLIGLFVYLMIRGFIIAKRAPDTFSSMLAAGLTAKVGLQAILNIAVVTASIPTTGIALPFFSYGGSALVMQMAEMGIVLSISRFSRIKEL